MSGSRACWHHVTGKKTLWFFMGWLSGAICRLILTKLTWLFVLGKQWRDPTGCGSSYSLIMSVLHLFAFRANKALNWACGTLTVSWGLSIQYSCGLVDFENAILFVTRGVRCGGSFALQLQSRHSCSHRLLLLNLVLLHVFRIIWFKSNPIVV